ncbi:Proteasome subunit beta type-4 [Coelomomyces lativittatus]|nr:Proteasome subunit beta type-4 [Coelomomyces lativittatus]KAJ1502037.1 Proteasome subunit beta type-4 [Coelomomyces lativittatus]KAJ1503241.1 Proteasome subunit beta type-4 [Coelomomyces lativittatus]
METLIGLVGKDFVLLASDTQSIRSIVVMKSNEDRSRELNATTLLMYAGEPGDSVNFVDFIQKNIQLHEFTYGQALSTQACAAYTRRQLAERLRSRGAVSTNLLMGGYSSRTHTPSLFWLDYLASCVQLPYACQGYGSYFCYSILDRLYHDQLSYDQAFQVLTQCIQELHTRFMVHLPYWNVHLLNKDGTKHHQYQFVQGQLVSVVPLLEGSTSSSV